MKRNNSVKIKIDIKNSFILGYQGTEIFIEGKDCVKGNLCAVAFNSEHYEALKNLANIIRGDPDNKTVIDITHAEVYEPSEDQAVFFCNLAYPEIYKVKDFILKQDQK